MSTHVFDVLDVEEVVGGDPSPGVCLVVVSQPVLELGLLSPDLLSAWRPLPLAKQSSHGSPLSYSIGAAWLVT